MSWTQGRAGSWAPGAGKAGELRPLGCLQNKATLAQECQGLGVHADGPTAEATWNLQSGKPSRIAGSKVWRGTERKDGKGRGGAD